MANPLSRVRLKVVLASSLNLAMLGCISCDDATNPNTNPPAVCRITVNGVSGVPASMEVGETTVVSVGYKPTGNCTPSELTATWGTSHPTLFSVVSTGSTTALLTALAPASPSQTLVVSATMQGSAGSAFVHIVEGAATTLTILPANPAVPAGTTQQLTAQLRNQFGAVIVGTSSAVAWSIPALSVATVHPSSGLLTAGSTQGIATVTATYSAVTPNVIGITNVTVTAAPAPAASITVTPASLSLNIGATQQLVATVKDAQGNTLTGRAVTWMSLTPGVATVSPLTGLTTTVSAVAAGGPVTIRVIADENQSVRTDVPVTVAGCLRGQVISDDFTTDLPGAWTTAFTRDNQFLTDAVTYRATGGFPGGYREMTHNMVGTGTIYVYHLREVGYDPSAFENAIHHLNYTESQISINPPVPGAAVGWGFFLEQNGVRYLKSVGSASYTSTTWQNNSLISMTAADFPGANFGVGGGIIKFGFYRANTSTGGVYTITHGIDNWSVQVCKQ